MDYVDLDTMKVCSRDFLLKKYGKAKAAGVPLSAADLIDMKAVILEGSVTGDVATGKAVMYGSMYQREYRDFTTAELTQQELAWCDAQFPLVLKALRRVQDGHRSKVGLVGQWRAYRNDLRDYPESEGFPDVTLNPRPVEPT